MALVRRAEFSLREVDDSIVSRLSAGLGVHPVTARCLAGRGIACEGDARSYLEPRLAGLRPPEGLAGLDAAIERLTGALVADETIGVFGDYDVDGVTTCALLTTYLRAAGARCVPRVARRDAGYGFQVADVEALASAGCSVLLVGDCGTCDLEAIEAARARGVEVIVIDHHAVPPGDPAAHPALALINPLRPDSTFPFRGMASVGLAFYVMAALRSRLVSRRALAQAPDLRELLDLVALGTIADVVPLERENRILTTHGLRLLSRRARPGIAALLERAGVGSADPIDERTVAWKIGPRLNAPGRLGDAAPALELLLAGDGAAAAAAAAALEEQNELRRRAQDKVLAEARELAAACAGAGAVVVAGEGWPSGVVGIAAAKLCEEHGVPAFVLAVDRERGEARGSARSVPGIDLVDILSRCSDVLSRYGGHAGAAGLTVAPERIDELTEAITAAVASDEPSAGGSREPADAEVALADLDDRLVAELGHLAPFGCGNEEPRLVSRGLRVRRSRRVGDGSHLKLELEAHGGARAEAIGFGLGELDPGRGAEVDALYAPTISTWGGRRRVELRLCDLAVS